MANVSIIPEDYDGLKKEYIVLRKELDSANQELYGSKRQLKILEALQQEYQSEIEILQSEEKTEKQKYEDKIAQLEENITNIRLKCNERVQALEVDLSKKEAENETLQVEVELLKKVNDAHTPVEDTSKLFEEVVALKQENEALLEREEELKMTVDNLQRNFLALEETLTEHRAELSNLKENLCCKREELMEANDLIQKLNDEVYCLKSELESYRSKPLNTESKGNSLFAEVDDRRVFLQKTINSMKSEYVSMKQERAKHLNTISHLRKENRELCERWKADMEEKEEDQDMVLKAYKDRIHICETLIEKYKQDLSAKPVVISTGSFSEIEFYQAMFNNKAKEIEELRNQISSRGLSQVMLSMSLKEANKEIRKWRLEATLRQCQLDLKLGDLLSESKVMEKIDEVMERRVEVRTDPKDYRKVESKEVITIMDSSVSDSEETSNVREDSSESKCVESEESDSIDLEKTAGEAKIEAESESVAGKENLVNNEGKTSRKVTFSQNTTSPKPTDKTALRRNCRRLEVPKPVYFSSE